MKLWPFTKRENPEPTREPVRTSPLLDAMRAEILAEMEPLLFELEANLMRLENALQAGIDPAEIRGEIGRVFMMGQQVMYANARLLTSDLSRMPQGAPLMETIKEIKTRMDALTRFSN